jgi:hypothetical protein
MQKQIQVFLFCQKAALQKNLKGGDADDCRRSKSTDRKQKSKQGVQNGNRNENQTNVGRVATRGSRPTTSDLLQSTMAWTVPTA